MVTISYYDVLLRESDWQLLSGPFWLNDQIIAFYYEYLTREEIRDATLCFLPGATCFFVLNAEVGDIKTSLATPLRLQTRARIFAAVNNNTDVMRAEGGSHWSLVIWDRKDGAFYHLDSCRGMNDSVARRVAEKLLKVMSVEGPMQFITPAVPQQRNGYDCALYLLKFTQILSNSFSDWLAGRLQLIETVTADCVSKLRQELMELIISKR